MNRSCTPLVCSGFTTLSYQTQCFNKPVDQVVLFTFTCWQWNLCESYTEHDTQPWTLAKVFEDCVLFVAQATKNGLIIGVHRANRNRRL